MRGKKCRFCESTDGLYEIPEEGYVLGHVCARCWHAITHIIQMFLDAKDRLAADDYDY